MSDNQPKTTKNILAKIMASIRTESQNLRDSVLDSIGADSFTEQLDAAELNLKQAKSDLSDEMAQQAQSTRLQKILADKIDQQELLIVDALSKGDGQGDEDQAFKLATEMVELEQDQLVRQGIQRSHELHLGHLTRQLENTERLLKDLQRQLAMVNTTQRIQKATATITESFSQADAKMLSAKKALDRIRTKQQHIDEQYEVSELMTEEADLEQKFDKISAQTAEDILNRLADKD